MDLRRHLLVLVLVGLTACWSVSAPAQSFDFFGPAISRPVEDLSVTIDAGTLGDSAVEAEPVESEFSKAWREWLRGLFPDELTDNQILMLPYYQWISLLVVIFAGILVDWFVRSFLNRLVIRWFKLAKIQFDEEIERGIWKPVGLLSMAVVWYVGMVIIGLPTEVLNVLLLAVQFFAVVAAVWTTFRMIDLFSSFLLKRASKTSTKFDDLLIPLISRTLKVFVGCIGLVSFAEAFNLPIAGLISGLGIGGVAIAFASKDTVANLFGSLTVLVDRPFEIGDWIVTDGAEGSVETVGMRSTRVRTFYNSLITIPNSNLTTAVVDNMGRRHYRRIKTTLGLQYDTPPAKIEAFCEGVRELIRRHPYTRKDYYHVYFNQFSASSLDVLLYCFIQCPDWAIELRERQRLFLDILKLANELGVSFAFPTQTLHVHQETSGGPPPPPPADDPLLAGKRLAAKVAGPAATPQTRPGGVQYEQPFEPDEGDHEPAKLS
jgi:MscS family membrane protein